MFSAEDIRHVLRKSFTPDRFVPMARWAEECSSRNTRHGFTRSDNDPGVCLMADASVFLREHFCLFVASELAFLFNVPAGTLGPVLHTIHSFAQQIVIAIQSAPELFCE